MSFYTIQARDTFNSIASKLGTDVQTLENLNPGVNPDDLQIGQVIHVPGTRTYTIVKGDTFSSIASKLGTDVQTLENLNPRVNPDDLQIGQVIKVPSGPVPAPGPTPDNGYVSFSGPATNFPAQSSWADYQSLWNFNSSMMPNTNFAGLEDNISSVNVIGEFIPTIAAESHVDARLILCIIMQESHGDIQVNTSFSPPPANIPNTGIMQAHDGATWQQAAPWPAPLTSIIQMIRDGAEKTATGPGLMVLFEKYQNWYEVARAYNSGSVDPTNLSNGLGATDSYVSDVANRLLGHVWPTM